MDDLLRHLISEMAQAQTRKLGIPRVSKIDQLKQMASDPPKYAIRFTGETRSGHQVDMIWEEGYGTFLYPLNRYVFRTLISGELAFSTYNYVHIFEMPTGLLELGVNANDISDETAYNVFYTLVKNKSYNSKIKLTPGKRFDLLYAISTNHNIIINAKKLYNDLKDDIGSNTAFFEITRYFNQPALSKILTKLTNISGFIDYGNKALFKGENFDGVEDQQMIVVNPSALRWVETIKTSDLMSFRETIHGNKKSSKEHLYNLQDKYREIASKAHVNMALSLKDSRYKSAKNDKIEKLLKFIRLNVRMIEEDYAPSALRIDSTDENVGDILYYLCMYKNDIGINDSQVEKIKDILSTIGGEYENELLMFLNEKI